LFLSIRACDHASLEGNESIRGSNGLIGITNAARIVFVDTAARRLGVILNEAASVGRDESGITKSLRVCAGEHRTINHDNTVRILNRVAITNVTNRFVETAACILRFILDERADLWRDESCVSSGLCFFTGEHSPIDDDECVRIFNSETRTNITRRCRAGEDWYGAILWWEAALSL
jgi:hypothetical protein